MKENTLVILFIVLLVGFFFLAMKGLGIKEVSVIERNRQEHQEALRECGKDNVRQFDNWQGTNFTCKNWEIIKK